MKTMALGSGPLLAATVNCVPWDILLHFLNPLLWAGSPVSYSGVSVEARPRLPAFLPDSVWENAAVWRSCLALVCAQSKPLVNWHGNEIFRAECDGLVLFGFRGAHVQLVESKRMWFANEIPLDLGCFESIMKYESLLQHANDKLS